MKLAAGTKGKATKQPKAMSNPGPGMYPNMTKTGSGNLNKRGIRRGKKR